MTPSGDLLASDNLITSSSDNASLNSVIAFLSASTAVVASPMMQTIKRIKLRTFISKFLFCVLRAPPAREHTPHTLQIKCQRRNCAVLMH
jgi:hypothetical protein